MILKSPTLFGIENKGAIFSTDRLYRYHLWRVWDNSLPRIAFIGLNPSTANEMKPDPTITRVCGFAKSWGYGGVDMFNLFAIVDSNPEVLMTCADPIKENDCHLKTINNFCSAVCFAWGNFKEARERAKVVAAMFPNALCLKKNKNGTPIHPLYVKGDTKPIRFNQ